MASSPRIGVLFSLFIIAMCLDICFAGNDFFNGKKKCLAASNTEWGKYTNCDDVTCLQFLGRENCTVTKEHTGCHCKPGFYKSSENQCISGSECNINMCGASDPNLVYGPYTNCDSQSCLDFLTGVQCTVTSQSIGCHCPSGFYKNNQNICTASSQCGGSACPAGEGFYSCPGFMPCSDACVWDATCDLNYDEVCRPGCYCSNGRCRGSDNVCTYPPCPENEMYMKTIYAPQCLEFCNADNLCVSTPWDGVHVSRCYCDGFGGYCRNVETGMCQINAP